MIIHHRGAYAFYRHTCNNSDRYQDKDFHPETYKDRNCYARDIDTFVEQEGDWVSIEKAMIDGMKQCLLRKMWKEVHNYNAHPLFNSEFSVCKYTYIYTYDSSFQSKGTDIKFEIDVVTRKNATSSYPWSYVADCICNCLYMDKGGLHFPEERADPISNALKLNKVIEAITRRQTYLPTPSCYYLHPSAFTEDKFRKTSYIVHYTGGWDAPDDDDDEDVKAKYRVMYRKCIIRRLHKTFMLGFTITNSPLLFKIYENTNEVHSFCNGETECCISHEEFQDGSCLVKLKESKYVMLYSSLLKHLDHPTPNVLKELGGANWNLLCPVSRTITPVFDGTTFSDFLATF